MKTNKGLTLTIIFEAESMNYGESMGNVSVLKKMTKSDGKTYTYVSRQALRYNIVEQMGCDNTPTSSEKGVVQFSPETSIDKYAEIDLFGYLKTEKGSSGAKRSAVVRLSNAESLTPFASDADFLNNMGLASRCGADNALAKSEIHNAMYAYTVTIDLDRVGIDGDIEISQEEKAKRICDLLDTIKTLHRDIKGRTENLNPVFVVGGVYDSKNPFFLGNLRMENGELDCDLLADTINCYKETEGKTLVAASANRFANANDIKSICTDSIHDLFEKVKDEVTKYYESDKD